MKNIFFLVVFLIGCGSDYQGIDLNTQLQLYKIPAAKYERTVQDGAVPSILFLGDSRISDFDSSYFPGRMVVNGGMDGQYVQYVYIAGPSLAAEYKPDIIVISAGLFQIQRNFQTEKMSDYYSLIIQYIRYASPLSVIYFTEIMPGIDGTAENDAIKEMNIELQAVCISEGVNYIHLDGMKNASGNLDAAYSSDGLHYSDSGYDKFAEILKGAGI